MAESDDTKGAESRLSTRGRAVYDYTAPMMTWGQRYIKNKYHATDNPQGIINLGIAENSLCEELLCERMNKEGIYKFTPNMIHYFDYTGETVLKNAFAKFFTRYLHSVEELEPENFIVTSGAGSALDFLCQVLFNEDDYVLILCPYYGQIDVNYGIRNKVKCLRVTMQMEDDGRGGVCLGPVVVDLERTLTKAKEEGKSVTGITLINPMNPTGTVMNKQTLHDILDFAARHDLEVIADEVYALSVFHEAADFHSVLSLPDIPDRVHFVWSFSKDFAMAGLRMGAIHTANRHVHSCAAKLMYFCAVPPVISHVMADFISDTAWLDNVYFPTNLKRMREAYDYCSVRLRDMGISCLPSQAGFFMWADFSKLMAGVEREDQMKLFESLMNAGVYIVPGLAFFHPEYRYFRITFTMRRDVLDIDYTLWPFDVDTDFTPPLKKTSNGKVCDAHESKIECFEDVPQIIQKLHKQGYILGLASRFHQLSGIPFSEMMFFDDLEDNIRSVQGLGVTAIFVEDGMTLPLLEHGLKEFKKNHSTH